MVNLDKEEASTMFVLKCGGNASAGSISIGQRNSLNPMKSIQMVLRVCVMQSCSIQIDVGVFRSIF